MILWAHTHNSSTGPSGEAVGTSFEDHRHNTSHGLTEPPIVLPAGNGVLLHTHNASTWRLEAVARVVVEVVTDGGRAMVAAVRRRVPASVVLAPLSLVASIAQATARGRGVARAWLDARSSIGAGAVGYLGPSDDEVASALALILGRTS